MFKRMTTAVLIGFALVLVLGGLALAQGARPPADGTCLFGCGGPGAGMGGFGYHGTLPTIIAETLGMTVEELYAALEDGQTIAEIAGDQFDAVVAAVLEPRIERIEQAVADGYLTQEQADAMIAQMTEHMTWRLENYGLGYGGGCGMGGGVGGRGGMHGGRWGGNSFMPRFQWSAPSGGA